MKVKPMVIIAIIRLGKSPMCQYTRTYARLVDTILPRLGTGSSIPSPKKLNPASAKITALEDRDDVGEDMSEAHSESTCPDGLSGDDKLAFSESEELTPSYSGFYNPA